MNLLLTGAFRYEEHQLKVLKKMGHRIYYIQDETVPLKEQQAEIPFAEIEGIICNALFLYNNIADFKKLRFLQLTSAGYDRVPMDWIQKKGIKLFNARGVYSIPMAEWAVYSALEFYKKAEEFRESQRKHIWKKERNILEISGKRTLIIGAGSVGREVAKRFQAFDACVVGIDKYPVVSTYFSEIYPLEYLERELEKAEILILTLPLTEETYHLLDKRRLFMIKDDAVLINISRGKVMDEGALIDQLQQGRFGGVALDVFEEEPLPENSLLWSLKNVRITPHNSFVSERNGKRMFEMIKRNLENEKEHQ